MTRKTTILVSEGTWHRLNSKKKLGESMDDVISKILDKVNNK